MLNNHVIILSVFQTKQMVYYENKYDIHVLLHPILDNKVRTTLAFFTIYNFLSFGTFE